MSSFYACFCLSDERDFNPARSHLARLDPGQEQQPERRDASLGEKREGGGSLKKHGKGREMTVGSTQLFMRERKFEFTGSEATKAEEI